MSPLQQLEVPASPFAAGLTAGTPAGLVLPAGQDFIIDTLVFQPTSGTETELTIVGPGGDEVLSIHTSYAGPNYGRLVLSGLGIVLAGGGTWNFTSSTAPGVVSTHGRWLIPGGSALT